MSGRTDRASSPDWEELARLDPFFAVLSDPGRIGKPWSVDAFFETGRIEVEGMLAEVGDIATLPTPATALDFGCGLGRLTRPLAATLGRCVGVDVSGEMIRRARELNAEQSGCEFVELDDTGLARFEDGSFDLVYSAKVLQHLPSADVALATIGEFIRIIRPGGVAAFQAPTRIARLKRLQPRRRIYAALRRLGASPEFLFRRLRTFPISMIALPEASVRATVEAAGGRILQTRPAPDSGPSMPGLMYFAAR